ncbi:beta-ketoacyl-[acyl-carrier-protein] synthase II [Rickettsiales endosymbiont of Peranema trichophorum]|uniref:beta-ketoacyl-ACP synthase II n=1 Tax=Rickettsiales endosymbiont of Peranema trichophorum TaxID=2486577 RepID=UPI001022AAFF|nr:beta-ketoacyl-ACP synthase II [Rickettsiales endosymbiont of Peranema trichophorum]RZI46325.1 beta-ketoacyl-[acyl-carrier-protein] synthase II [Rickettsiales endosymbiont of Peranema trichophorum]
MRRVVITGVGLVTPLGASVRGSWSRLIAGESGVDRIPETLFDTSDLATQIAGIIPDSTTQDGLDLSKYISTKDLRKMDRFMHLAIAAASQAIEDAGWNPSSEASQNRTGVFIGSGIGGLTLIEENAKVLFERGPNKVTPFFIPSSLINLAAGHIAMKYGFKGPNHSVATACSSGAHAIGDAARMIAYGYGDKDGYADVMIAGGSEGAICRLGIVGFNACRSLSTNFNHSPHQASRPWDRDRDGFVMGEGAGVLVLEEYEHAKKRGARIYAELVGYGVSCDAYHMTAPSPEGTGALSAMKMALEQARLNTDDIDYINAHGTSTQIGDMIELNAVKALFLDAAYKLSMSSTKSATGHLLGAAGSVEAIFSILAMQEGIVPPTLNLDNPSDGCDIDLVRHQAKQRKVEIALSNSFGFGGTNASLIFRRI